MKRVFLLFCISFYIINANSQLIVNTFVNPPYSPYFEDYLQYDNKLVLSIKNTSNIDIEFYFRGSIIGDNGVEIMTQSNFRPSEPFIVLAGQTMQLTGGDLDPYLNFDNVDVTGIEVNDIIGVEGLPEGHYQVCIQAFNWENDTQVSEGEPQGCADIYVQNIEPSIITTPACGDTVIASIPQNITFSWSISPGALPNTEYILQIVEVIEEQSPESAMESIIEPVFFEKQVKEFSYNFGAADPQLIEGHKYAVRVKSVDPSGEKVYRNQGFGEVCSFVYGSFGTTKDTIPNDGDDIAVGFTLLTKLNNCTISGKLLCKMPKDHMETKSLQTFIPFTSSMISTGGMSFNDFNFSTTSTFNDNSNNSIFGIGNDIIINKASIPSWNKYYEKDKESKEGAIPLSNMTIQFVPSLVLRNATLENGDVVPFVVMGKPEQNDKILNTLTYKFGKLNTDYLKNIPTVVTTTDRNGNFEKTFHLPKPTGFIAANVKWFRMEGTIETYRTGIKNNIKQNRVATGDLYFAYVLVVTDNYERFTSPNTIILPKVNDAIQLPDQISLIRAFHVQITVSSAVSNKKLFDQKGIIPGAEVTVFREKSSFDGERKEILKLEGQELHEWRYIGGKRVKIVCKAKTDDKGIVKLEFLSKSPSEYYFQVRTRDETKLKTGYEPNTFYNYKTKVGLLSASVHNYEYEDEDVKDTTQIWSPNYIIPVYGFKTYLIPHPPEIKGRVREKSSSTKTKSVNVPGLKGATVSLYNKQGGSRIVEKMLNTGSGGWFRFTNLWVKHKKGIAIGPKRYLSIWKKGYNRILRPNIDSDESPAVLSLGQFWWLGDIDLFPDSKVSGLVEDEDNNGVESYVNIIDGAYYKTQLGIRKAGIFYKFTQRFKMFTPTGGQLFIASPLSSKYFGGFLFKNIPAKDPTLIDIGPEYFDVGKITVYKKLHRIRVVVVGPVGQKLIARVSIGDVSTITQNGVAFFKFPSQASDFTLSVYPNNKEYMEYHEVIHLPNSSSEGTKKVKLYKGYTLNGQVVDKTTNQAVKGAKVSVFIGEYKGASKYISTTTDDNGNYTLKGIPTDDQSEWNTIEVFKETDPSAGFAYKVARKAINFGYDTEVPFIITQLERVPKINNIWGYPLAINTIHKISSSRIKISGYFYDIPMADGFQLADKDQRIYFYNIVLKKNAGEGFLPTTNSITLFTNEINFKVNNVFDGVLFMASGYGSNPNLHLVKNGNSETGFIEGMMRIEASSFKSSYDYSGDLFIGNGTRKFVVACRNDKKTNNDKEKFGVFQFSFSNRWRKKVQSDITDFHLFGFSAVGERTMSFMEGDEIHLSASIQTDIKNCTPSNLNFKIGEILITSTTADFVKTADNKLNFKIDNWDVIDKKGWTFDKNEEAFILKEVLINTHQGVDFRVKGMRVKYDELAEGEVSSKGGLTLGGVVDLNISSKSNISFFYDEGSATNGQYIITVTSAAGGYAAQTNPLPGLTGSNKRLAFDNITLGSADKTPSMAISMEVKYQNIIDFTILGIQTLDGVLNIQGQPDVHIPNLELPGTILKYTKKGNSIKHEMISLDAVADTYGGVHIKFDTSRQIINHSLFETYVDIALNPSSAMESEGESIVLRGLLTKKPNSCKIKIIKTDSEGKFEDNNGKFQIFPTGDLDKSLVIKSGEQIVTSNKWKPMQLKALSSNSDGMNGKENEFKFIVHGAIDIDNDEAKIDNIDIGIGKLDMTYNWSDQSINGSLMMRVNIPCGPVTLVKGGTGFCRFGSGGFYIGYSGSLTISGFNVTNASMVLGWHDNVLDKHKNLAIGYFINKSLINKTQISEGKVHGIFIGAQKIFWNDEIYLGVPTFFINTNAGMEVFLEASFKNPISMTIGGFATARGAVICKPPAVDAYCITGAAANVSLLGQYKDSQMNIDTKGSLIIDVAAVKAELCMSLHLGTSDPKFDVDISLGNCGEDSSDLSSCP